VPPFTRRVELAYLFRDWFEPGPYRTRWHATVGLLARTDDGGLAFTFMGSADARHAVTNLQLLQDHDGEGRTARGMRGAFERVRRGAIVRLGDGRDPGFAPIEAACAGRWTRETGDGATPVCVPADGGLAALLEAVVAATLADDARAPVHATGHSLGGALALQLALVAARTTPRVYVTTFGEPPYGDAAFFETQAAKFPALVANYDRRVAVTRACKTDIVPETTRLAGGGGHFAPPHFLCGDTPPANVVSAHAMVGYFRGLRDHARRDFGLDLEYAGPGFWGSLTPDDPLLVAERERANRPKKAPFWRRGRAARTPGTPRFAWPRLRTRWVARRKGADDPAGADAARGPEDAPPPP
jgi:hypothetical protein